MTKKIMIVFSSLLIMIQVLFLVFTNYKNYVDVQALISNHLVSSHSVNLIFRGENKPFLKTLSKLMDQHGVIGFIEIENNSSLKLIGVYGDYQLKENLKPMLTGRFPVKPHLIREAVVGRKIVDTKYYFTTKNKESYFRYRNKEYVVTGIFDGHYNQMIDNDVYIGLDKNEVLVITKLIVDSNDAKNIKEFMNHLREMYHVDILSGDQNIMKSFFVSESEETLFDSLAIVLIITFISLLILFILNNYKDEIKVNYFVGVPFLATAISIFKVPFVLMVVHLAMISSVYAVLYKIFLYRLYLPLVLLELFFFVLLLTSIVFCLIIVYVFLYYKLIYKHGVK